MRSARPVALACLAMLAVSGCRTGGGGNVAAPAPVLTPNALSKAQVIDRLNRNARLVESLKVFSSITVNIADREKHSVKGKLALERPRNFKLEMESARGTEADIGSNDKEFWFWTRPTRSQKKEIYVCDYDESGQSPLEGPLQPEWIIEALGLREISDDEAARIVVEPAGGPGSDLLSLTQRIDGSNGVQYKKVMMVEKASGLIREDRLYRLDGDRKTLLSAAVISGYQKVAIAPTAVTAEAGRTVILPNHVRLTWWNQESDDREIEVPGKFEIDVVLQAGAEINKSINAALFEEPKLSKDYTRINLADRAGPAGNDPADPSIRESRSAPPTGGVRLGVPEAGPERSPAADRSSRDDRPPVALSGELPSLPSRASEVVGPLIPTAPEPEFATTSHSTWRSASSPLMFER